MTAWARSCVPANRRSGAPESHEARACSRCVGPSNPSFTQQLALGGTTKADPGAWSPRGRHCALGPAHLDGVSELRLPPIGPRGPLGGGRIHSTAGGTVGRLGPRQSRPRRCGPSAWRPRKGARCASPGAPAAERSGLDGPLVRCGQSRLSAVPACPTCPSSGHRRGSSPGRPPRCYPGARAPARPSLCHIPPGSAAANVTPSGPARSLDCPLPPRRAGGTGRPARTAAVRRR